MSSSADPAETGTCLVLVDYDNAFPPSSDLSYQEIALEVGSWLKRLSTHFPSLSRFEIRLYGGWYDDTDLSRHGSEVARVLTYLPEFPINLDRGRIIRGGVSLAVNPLASKTTSPLLGTYRRRGSLPRLRLTRQPYPDSCEHADERCPAVILKSFTKHSSRECPVSACSLIASDAFVIHEQKMVDTMLATDILTAGRMPETYSSVIVVSGDSDFVPPLLAAKMIGDVALVQLRPRVDEASEYATSVLADVGITIF